MPTCNRCLATHYGEPCPWCFRRPDPMENHVTAFLVGLGGILAILGAICYGIEYALTQVLGIDVRSLVGAETDGPLWVPAAVALTVGATLLICLRRGGWRAIRTFGYVLWIGFVVLICLGFLLTKIL